MPENNNPAYVPSGNADFAPILNGKEVTVAVQRWAVDHQAEAAALSVTVKQMIEAKKSWGEIFGVIFEVIGIVV
jgi:hypothetical protein